MSGSFDPTGKRVLISTIQTSFLHFQLTPAVKSQARLLAAVQGGEQLRRTLHTWAKSPPALAVVTETVYLPVQQTTCSKPSLFFAGTAIAWNQLATAQFKPVDSFKIAWSSAKTH